MAQEQTYESVRDQKKRARKENLKIALYAIVGLAITILSFVLFHHFGDLVFVTVLLCIGDVAYAYWNALQFCKWLKNRGEKHFIVPWVLLMYWVTVFAVVCAFNFIVLEGPFSYTFFLYPFFLMPAFVIEILLLGFVGSGI